MVEAQPLRRELGPDLSVVGGGVLLEGVVQRDVLRAGDQEDDQVQARGGEEVDGRPGLALGHQHEPGGRAGHEGDQEVQHEQRVHDLDVDAAHGADRLLRVDRVEPGEHGVRVGEEQAVHAGELNGGDQRDDDGQDEHRFSPQSRVPGARLAVGTIWRKLCNPSWTLRCFCSGDGAEQDLLVAFDPGDVLGDRADQPALLGADQAEVVGSADRPQGRAVGVGEPVDADHVGRGAGAATVEIHEDVRDQVLGRLEAVHGLAPGPLLVGAEQLVDGRLLRHPAPERGVVGTHALGEQRLEPVPVPPVETPAHAGHGVGDGHPVREVPHEISHARSVGLVGRAALEAASTGTREMWMVALPVDNSPVVDLDPRIRQHPPIDWTRGRPPECCFYLATCCGLCVSGRKLVVERAAYFALVGQGVGFREAARRVGVGYRLTKRWRAAAPAVEPVVEPEISARLLNLDERVLIADLRRESVSVREIGRRLERPASTISRELARNQQPNGSYRPHAPISWPCGDGPARRSARSPLTRCCGR